jgi:TrpR-related protein YerC/YecD
MKRIPRKDIDELFHAILTLKTADEAKAFFRDLLTETEIREITERWKAARMLAAGIPYTRIIDETGLSSTTVARVARWVKKGTGGYQLAINRTGLRQV